ncbi:MAG TPA: hypothetical protein VJ259_06920, partial [Actinomycetota bacterium]|nr:hypothetical protein [Actinomycetota bacterium]
AVPFEDLVPDPSERPADLRLVHQRAQRGTPPRAAEEVCVRFTICSLPSRPRGTGLKGFRLKG